MAKWYGSGLASGEELFGDITETGKPAYKVRYVQDIPCGIIVELFFKDYSYKKCLNWASIHIGEHKVRTASGQIRAKRIVQKGEWDDGED